MLILCGVGYGAGSNPLAGLLVMGSLALVPGHFATGGPEREGPSDPFPLSLLSVAKGTSSRSTDRCPLQAPR